MIREISRLLRPGGLVLLIEPSLHPFAEGDRPTPEAGASHVPTNSGWSSFWETYRACLTRQGIDISIPERLAEILLATGTFEDVIQRDGNIPVGFWPNERPVSSSGRRIGVQSTYSTRVEEDVELIKVVVKGGI
ncbi:hypothetical protein VKT23_004253 [Stygiomarasmius scandens]|uniref:Methyltransferase type 11 domain-containing protein n=1 Tax=Marasmiellus scandens TaxID=2682957 RepID=A0ABR1JWR6_9AGAR